MPTPWFALQTKPRNEKQVERQLTGKGYECLLPLYRQKRRWSDRIVVKELPLFPMYIFCRFSADVLGKAIATPGVTRIVEFGGYPAAIEEEEICSLQRLSVSSLLREPWAYIPKGTVVQVETGPLAGTQGFICNEQENRRLIISVTLLQRSVAVQLDESTVVSVILEPGQNRKQHPTLSAESHLALKILGR